MDDSIEQGKDIREYVVPAEAGWYVLEPFYEEDDMTKAHGIAKSRVIAWRITTGAKAHAETEEDRYSIVEPIINGYGPIEDDYGLLDPQGAISIPISGVTGPITEEELMAEWNESPRKRTPWSPKRGRHLRIVDNDPPPEPKH